MIKDIRVYPWKAHSDKSHILTKIFNFDSSYSVITPLSSGNGLDAIRKAVSSLRENLITMDEEYWESTDEMLESVNENTETDPGILLGISLSMCKAATQGELWRINEVRQKMKFPRVWFSVIRGRVSGSGSDWKNFMVFPERIKNPLDMQAQLLELWSEIGEELQRTKKLTGKDIENRWISKMNTPKTLEFLSRICKDRNISMGVDCGSWKYNDSRIYNYKNENKKLSEKRQIAFVKKMCNDYNLKYIENPFIPDSAELLNKVKKSIKSGISADIRHGPPLQEILESDSVPIISNSPDLFYNFTGIRKYTEFVEKKGKTPVFSAPEYAIKDPWIVDVCIALKVPFIKVTPLEGLSVFNRLNELWYDVPNEII